MGIASIEGRAIGLDTVGFIYFIQEHPAYVPILRPLFHDADMGKRRIVTSAITLLEVLVVPYRHGNATLAERYEALLMKSRGIELVPIDHVQLRGTAQLRARYGLKTPDGLQLSAALSRRCTTFVTNDRRMPEVPGLEVLQLDDLVSQ